MTLVATERCHRRQIETLDVHQVPEQSDREHVDMEGGNAAAGKAAFDAAFHHTLVQSLHSGQRCAPRAVLQGKAVYQWATRIDDLGREAGDFQIGGPGAEARGARQDAVLIAQRRHQCYVIDPVAADLDTKNLKEAQRVADGNDLTCVCRVALRIAQHAAGAGAFGARDVAQQIGSGGRDQGGVDPQAAFGDGARGRRGCAGSPVSQRRHATRPAPRDRTGSWYKGQ
jgi:hypothetical protein